MPPRPFLLAPFAALLAALPLAAPALAQPASPPPEEVAALVDWSVRVGLPSLAGKPLVRGPAGELGFLLEEGAQGGAGALVLHDLRPVRSGPGVVWARVDLETELEAVLHGRRTERPLDRIALVTLALGAHASGLPGAARALVARAAAARGTVHAPHLPAAALCRAEIRALAFAAALEAHAARRDEEALSRLRRVERACPGTREGERAAEYAAALEAAAEAERARAASPPADEEEQLLGGQLRELERVPLRELVGGLREVAALDEVWRRDGLGERLARLGHAAAPRLVAALDGSALTRIVVRDEPGRPRLIPVRTLAREILERIAGRPFQDADEARAWWSLVASVGEVEALVQGVEAGGEDAPVQALRLLRADRLRALEVIPAAARRQAPALRAALFHVLAADPGFGAGRLLEAELEAAPDLRCLLVAARGVAARRSAAWIEPLVAALERELGAADPPAEQSADEGPSRATGPVGDQDVVTDACVLLLARGGLIGASAARRTYARLGARARERLLLEAAAIAGQKEQPELARAEAERLLVDALDDPGLRVDVTELEPLTLANLAATLLAPPDPRAEERGPSLRSPPGWRDLRDRLRRERAPAGATPPPPPLVPTPPEVVRACAALRAATSARAAAAPLAELERHGPAALPALGAVLRALAPEHPAREVAALAAARLGSRVRAVRWLEPPGGLPEPWRGLRARLLAARGGPLDPQLVIELALGASRRTEAGALCLRITRGGSQPGLAVSVELAPASARSLEAAPLVGFGRAWSGGVLAEWKELTASRAALEGEPETPRRAWWRSSLEELTRAVCANDLPWDQERTLELAFAWRAERPEELAAARRELASQQAWELVSEGNAQLRAGELEDAIATFTRALELGPALPWAWGNRAIARRRAGDLAGALEDYARAIALDPDSPTPYYNRAFAHRERGALRDALADYTRALERSPSYGRAWHDRAVTRFELGDAEGALDDLARALELDPEQATSWYTRGLVLKRLRRYEEARAAYGRALELRPDDGNAWNNRGNVHHHLRDYEAARRDYLEALAAGATSADVHYNLGLACRNTGRLEEALAAFEAALARAPGDVVAQRQLERTRRALEARRLVTAELDRAVAERPADPEVWVRRARTRAELGEWTGALEDAAHALALRPHAEAHLLRARARLALAEDGFAAFAALADLDRAVELEPGLADAWHERGALLLALDQPAPAAEALDRALSLGLAEPGRAYQQRGRALLALGRREAARADLDQALAFAGDSAAAFAARGAARRELGDLEGALADGDEAVRLDPRKALWRSQRGLTLLALGREKAALEACDAAVGLAPAAALPRAHRARVQLARGELLEARADLRAAAALPEHTEGGLRALGEAATLAGDHALAAELLGRLHAPSPRSVALQAALGRRPPWPPLDELTAREGWEAALARATAGELPEPDLLALAAASAGPELQRERRAAALALLGLAAEVSGDREAARRRYARCAEEAPQDPFVRDLARYGSARLAE